MESADAQRLRFGRWFAEAVRSAGFKSVNSFARTAEVDASVLNRWIRGETIPTAANLLKVAPHLHVEEAALFAAAFPTGDPPDTPALEPELADLIAEVRAVDGQARADLLAQIRWLVDGARWRRKRQRPFRGNDYTR